MKTQMNNIPLSMALVCLVGFNIGPVVPNIFDRWIKERTSKN